jgi:hypothetical protein
MKIKKTFDCVKMKDDIQAALYLERKDMSQEEVRRTIEQNLITSRMPAAVLWRRLSKAKKPRARGRVLAHAK